MKKNISHLNNRGFSLLLAVLISSLIMTIGLGIFNLTLKEAALSAASRESQFGLYAADSGIECALYWDVGAHPGGDVFVIAADGTAGPISCAGNSNITVSRTRDLVANAATSTFTYNFDGSADADKDILCVTVNVAKFQCGGGGTRTTIEGRGYNTCDPNNSHRIERGLYVKYGPTGCN